MQELEIDEIEFSAMIVLLLWTLDDFVDRANVLEESAAIGEQQKIEIYEELHEYFTNHGKLNINYAYRIATIASMVHAVDVRIIRLRVKLY